MSTRSATSRRYDGGAFFHEAPTVTAVAVPLDDGSMARGWLVETWTRERTCCITRWWAVTGASSTSRSAPRTTRYNVFPVSPLARTADRRRRARSRQRRVAGRAGSATARRPTINIIGNNVNAYLDTDNNNRADPGGTAVTTGNFLTAANSDAVSHTATNKAVAVQNLFYLNNVIHDILYRHGFDEAAGNFQTTTSASGGRADDAVKPRRRTAAARQRQLRDAARRSQAADADVPVQRAPGRRTRSSSARRST